MHQHFLLVGELLAVGLHREAEHHQRDLLERRDGAPLVGERRRRRRRPATAAPSSSSCSALAAGMSGKLALHARGATSMPGISSRLISLVPSKMRLTRASR